MFSFLLKDTIQNPGLKMEHYMQKKCRHIFMLLEESRSGETLYSEGCHWKMLLTADPKKAESMWWIGTTFRLLFSTHKGVTTFLCWIPFPTQLQRDLCIFPGSNRDLSLIRQMDKPLHCGATIWGKGLFFFLSALKSVANTGVPLHLHVTQEIAVAEVNSLTAATVTHLVTTVQ